MCDDGPMSIGEKIGCAVVVTFMLTVFIGGLYVIGFGLAVLAHEPEALWHKRGLFMAIAVPVAAGIIIGLDVLRDTREEEARRRNRRVSPSQLQ